MKSAILFLALAVAFSAVIASEKPEMDNEIQMEKIVTMAYDPPLPVAVIGTRSGVQVNFMASAWFTRLEVNPYLFGVSIQKQHFTHKAILENNCLSINIPTLEMLKQVDAVGLVSGKEHDKSQVFKVFYGDNDKCPMVDGSIVSFECEVVRSVDLVEYDQGYPRAHTLFIVEVKKVWANKNNIKDNAPDYTTLKPIIWTISPNNYWTIGENQGSAFNQDNRKLVPKKK